MDLLPLKYSPQNLYVFLTDPAGAGDSPVPSDSVCLTRADFSIDPQTRPELPC